MPTISFSLKDLQLLIGKKITPAELENLAHYCKAELQKHDKTTDEAFIELDDTNLPYLWSVEGVARLLKGVLGTRKGLYEPKVNRSTRQVNVDSSILAVRPHIAAFAAKGPRLDDYLLRQLVQLQEKLCDSYGRKRQKISVGLYSLKKIKFPVNYKAAPPSTKFVPLGMEKELSLKEILEQHPKGKDYGWILEDQARYPLLADSAGSVLSFPPIINSAHIGKLQPGETEIFFEVTGMEEEPVTLATNIFSYALSDRGYRIESATISNPDRKHTTPEYRTRKIRVSAQSIKAMLGIELTEPQTKDLLERAGYAFKNYTVTVPPYRADTMHPVDIIEDIAIMYGFHNITGQDLQSYTVGKPDATTIFIDKARELATGLGYHEAMSQILSNKTTMNTKMKTEDTGTIEIENPMSELFTCVRTWIIPLLLEMLSKNKHADFPQRVFEQGLTTSRKGSSITDTEKLALVSTHSTADLTEARQAAEYLLTQLGFKHQIKEKDFGCFIPGRSASIHIQGREIGMLGEISPEVLSAFGIEMPTVAAEIDLTALIDRN
ncbi:phenylalanine--tRNA ligase subunit beta [Candidatus Woesearchaeota archaeon]|nr:phenylalanine--tRNA ligase subunit beta [Candidatus Woesearchaeota archaeon]